MTKRGVMMKIRRHFGIGVTLKKGHRGAVIETPKTRSRLEP